MRYSFLGLALVLMAAAGCVDMEGDGRLTHSDHRLTAGEKAGIEAGMASYLKGPVQLSGLRAAYNLSDGSVPVCGYVAIMKDGRPTTPALFAGTLTSPAGRTFMPYRAPGAGQDPQRTATVRAFCQSHHIVI